MSVTLAQPWRNLLLSLHIAASVGVLGADLVLLALGVAGLNGLDPLAIYPAAAMAAAWLIAPLAFLTLATGLALALLTPWRLFRHWWVTAKLAIVLVLTGAVLFVLVPSLAEMADAVTGPTGATLTTAQRLPLVLAPAAATTLLIIALLLAVFKPTRRAPRAAAQRHPADR